MNAPDDSDTPTVPDTSPAARRVRLGELDLGTVAIGDRGGLIRRDGVPRAASRTSVSWWVGAEDRWHRPHEEASTRDRLVDDVPVLESSTRIPSGDAVGRTTVGRVDGDDRPSIIYDVENASPVPIVFAYVVESTEPTTTGADGVVVEGVGTLRLTRPAMGFCAAADADSLLARLAADDVHPDPEAGGARASGAVAVVVPLPHTAHAVAVFTPVAPDGHPGASSAGSGPERAPGRRVDRSAVPGPDTIATGWGVHRDLGARPVAFDDRRAAAWSAAVCDVLLGATTVDGEGSDAAVVARLSAARARLGLVDDPAPLTDLVEIQRPGGAIDGDDPVDATIAFIEAGAAWWLGGADPEFAQLVLGPIAQAAAWLAKRRQRAALIGRRDAATALHGAAAMAADLAQLQLARDLTSLADALAPRDGSAPGPSTAQMIRDRADGVAWASADGEPDPAASARFVTTCLDEVASSGLDAVALAPGFGTADAGLGVEAHAVPTRWGRLSYAVRWHGERPALLWEMTPWPDRTVAAPFRLTAPTLDPSWSADQWTGEALLAMPPGVTPAPTPEPAPEPAPSPDVDPGGSFS